MVRRSVLALGLGGGLATLSACAAILGIDESSLPEPDAGVDAMAAPPAKDGGVVPGADATIPGDAGTVPDASLADVEVMRPISVSMPQRVVEISPLGVLVGTDLRFGEALAFSPDGTWLAIGAPGAGRSDSDAGATGQVQLVSIDVLPAGPGVLNVTLLDPGQNDALEPAAGSSFGRSLAFSPDGRYLAVGAPQEPNASTMTSGDVYLYALTAGGWSYRATLQPGPESATWFGNTVAFNAPFPPSGSNVLFVAATGDTTETNLGSPPLASVSAYTFNGDGLISTPFKTMFSAQANDGFGWSLAVSSDAGVLLVGAPFARAATGDGRVYITSLATFEAKTGTPYSTSLDIDSGALLGDSVALPVNLSNAMVGAPRFNGVGAALAYGLNVSASPPAFSGAVVVLPDHDAGVRPAVEGGRFGECVAASANRAVIGEPARDGGACLAVSLPITYPLPVTDLPAQPSPAPEAGARYGATLATLADGGWVAVAAPGTDGVPAPFVYLTR